MADLVKLPYLMNGLSKKDGYRLKLTGMYIFLFPFHVMYTLLALFTPALIGVNFGEAALKGPA